MPSASAIVQRFPRTTSALMFGSLTGLATAAMWTAGEAARHIPLTLGAAAAYAIAGALMGRRLVDAERTRTAAQAARVGLVAALIATMVFAAGLSVQIEAENARALGASAAHTIVQGFAQLATGTMVFAFLGGGWALLLLSAAVAWGIHRVGAREP
jgi:hypothetical protein